jgi:hypothetical protein
MGATLFHGPVRDGKGWVQRAMAAKHNLSVRRMCGERKKGEGCWVVTALSVELLLKVIGSSHTGN